MVHHARKNSGKQNTTVYGVASDGDTFLFYRIGNESHVRNSTHCLFIIMLINYSLPDLFLLSGKHHCTRRK